MECRFGMTGLLRILLVVTPGRTLRDGLGVLRRGAVESPSTAL